MKKDKKKSELEKRIEDLENSWKRALADYDNLRKRVDKEKGELIKLANAALLDKLLAVLDNFEQVEKHLKDKGFKIALDQLRAVLKEEGLNEIEVLGKNFDPESMECVEVVDGEKNLVMEVIAKGYQLADFILRPAKVKVGKGKKDGQNNRH
jgi:molecular chaperone GrpE